MKKDNFSNQHAIVFGAIIIAAAILLQPLVGTGTGERVKTSREANVATSSDPVIAAAQKVGVKEKKIAGCIAEARYDGLVTAQSSDAVQAGGTGTPFSVIIGPDGTHYPVSGALPLSSIEAIVDIALEGAPEEAEGLEQITVAPVTDADHVRGNPDAPVMIVEYSDIDCPFCGRFHTTMKELVEKRDDVAWVYRHFPLESIHPNARAKAIAAECVAEASDNETFWAYLDELFEGKS